VKEANILIPLIKSYYASLLKPEDYQLLLNLNSVTEVLEYLMTTQYLQVLNVSTLHREEIEKRLKNYHATNLKRLENLVYGQKRQFIYLFLLRDDLNNFISLIKTKVQSFIFYDEKLNVKMDDSLSNILESIKTTAVGQIIKQALILGTFEELVAKVDNYYFNYVFKQINTLYRGALRNSLLSGLRDWVVAHNLKLIYRMKKYNYDITRESLVYINADQVNSVTNKLREISLSEMPETKYFLSSKGKDLNLLVEHIDSIYKFNYSHKNLRTVSSIEELFLAIFLLAKIEINNIIHIIEGKRYKLNLVSLDPLLVY
jgi:V/A-type H+-transporting ATPase subunit C